MKAKAAMCKFWNSFGKQYESTAKVVDGNLILSLPDAINPVIWRMELGNVKSSALEVRANDNHYLLALKTPKGDVHDIAPFESRDRAVYALMRVSDALGKAEGKIAPQPQIIQAAPTSTTSSPISGYKWLIALGCVIGLIFLASYWSSISPKSEMLGTQTTFPGERSVDNAESGVPLSADDYLRGF